MPSPKDRNGTRSRFRIGTIAVHPDRYVIIRDGEEISLAMRTMDLLVELAEANGKPVSREHLLKKVWKNGDLDDNPINKAISELRNKLGEDLATSQYIKTVHGKGYRTGIPVIFDKGYRRRRRLDYTWSEGSPYVGLAAFDASHADVFFGRDRMQEKVLRAMRTQLDNGGRLVILHGASGSGKTSLLRAGIIPKLTHPIDKDDLHALSVAHCDLASSQPSDAIGALAAALATWRLGDRPVFPLQSTDALKNFLIETPESMARIIDEAFERHPDRKVAENPLAHLLLVIDHGERLADESADTAMHGNFSRAISALCECERILAAVIARGDFYLKLQEALPDLIERKGSDGHVDILRPGPSEIAEIIRYPAECARVDFELDPESGDYLDDKILDDAAGKPDVLPLLQHTLEQLYERRDIETGMLTFAAYRAMGDLEGAIAHRADEVFSALPPRAQKSLDSVLSRLFVIQSDSDAVKRGGLSFDAFDDAARTLIDAFIGARLFVSEKDDKNRPRFGVTHEALLRRWPKATEWSQKNQRRLIARIELKAAADRWHESGRRKDHLLNPGIPLIEANGIAKDDTTSLTEVEIELISQSNRQRAFNLRLRRRAIAGLFVLSAVSICAAFFALISQAEAERQRVISAKAVTLVVGDFADRMDAKADSGLIKTITGIAIEYCEGLDLDSASAGELISCSRAHRKLGEVQISQSEYQKALENMNRSVSFSEKALNNASDSGKALKEAGEAKAWLGKARRRMGDMSGAISAWNDYLQLAKKLVADHSADPMSHLQLSYALTNLGSAENELGRNKNALDLFSESKRIKKSPLARRDNDNGEDSYELAVTASFICNINAKIGRLREAKDCYIEQTEVVKALLDIRQDANDWRRQLASFLQFQAELELDLGNPDQAEKAINEAIFHYHLLLSNDLKNDDWALYFAQAHLLAGEISRAKNDLHSAEEHFRLIEKLPPSKPEPSNSWKRVLASAQFKIARYGRNGPDPKGMRDAITSLEYIHTSDKNNRKTGLVLAEALVCQAEYYRKSGFEMPAKSTALKAIHFLDLSKIQEDERVHTSLYVRAHFNSGNLHKACAIATNKVLKEHKNIDYASMPLKGLTCPST